MKKTIPYLLSGMLTLATSMSLAEVKFNNVCSNPNSNQECVSVPLAKAENDAASKVFQSDATGKATVYLVRHSAAVRRQVLSLLINSKPVADLGPFTYAVLHLAPGDQIIRGSADKRAELRLNVKPGKLYFVQADLSLFFFTVSSRLKLIDETEGRSLVLKALLVAQP